MFLGITDWRQWYKEKQEKHRPIRWESQLGNNVGAASIEWDGTPFIYMGRHVLICHFGTDHNLKKKQEFKEKQDKKMMDDHVFLKRRNLVQSTNKLGCNARIYISQIVRFPLIKIPENVRKHKVSASECLRNDLSANIDSVHGVVQFVIRFPSSEDHTNHPVSGEGAMLREPVCSEVRDYIIKLTREGFRKVSDTMRSVNNFVNNELFRGLPKPDPLRRRYFPTRDDIRNIMMKAKMENRHSKNDQENLKIESEKWIENGDSVYFRPSALKEDGTAENFSLCYQSPWQRRLLSRYGNDLCLLDATYITLRYALPLFFLCVRTNVNYSVVGVFLTENESADSIQEALRVFQKWNPDWKPAQFATDYSLAEINAIESTFSDVSVKLCQFHMEKAWNEWLSKEMVCCISETEQDVMCKNNKLFRNVQSATDEIQFNAAYNVLQQSHICKSNNSIENVDITKVSDRLYHVVSNARTYTLTLGTENSLPACTCKDWIIHMLPCKHFCAIFKYVEGCSWNDLGHLYISNPIFSLDPACVPHVKDASAPICNDSEKIGISDEPVGDFSGANDDNIVVDSLDLPARRVSHKLRSRRECLDILKTMIDYVHILDENDLESLAG
ncbi:uncharacterized protein LOC141898911 [Tubulanus polymorphus]|uniref:uncharacterized protein LOC141898911 n=1 Tax=Tubulanus polymorphus TaxID=672921 RepID=UPI003DA42530